jgi:riboflavin kinase/FMN adenylyltransferase
LDENLYGKRLDLEFLAYLRDEQRFSTIQSLVTQIEQDVRQAREILDETKFDLGA